MWNYNYNSSELYHWKYLKKIGNRYFYTIKELQAFMQGEAHIDSDGKMKGFSTYRAWNKYTGEKRKNKNISKIEKSREKELQKFDKKTKGKKGIINDWQRSRINKKYDKKVANEEDSWDEKGNKHAGPIKKKKAEREKKAGHDKLNKAREKELSRIKDTHTHAEKLRKNVEKKYKRKHQNWEDHWDEKGNYHVSTSEQKVKRLKKKIVDKGKKAARSFMKELKTTHKKTGVHNL